MRNVWTIARREIRLYFASPIAYIVGLLILLISGIYFVLDYLPGRPGRLYHRIHNRAWSRFGCRAYGFSIPFCGSGLIHATDGRRTSQLAPSNCSSPPPSMNGSWWWVNGLARSSLFFS